MSMFGNDIGGKQDTIITHDNGSSYYVYSTVENLKIFNKIQGFQDNKSGLAFSPILRGEIHDKMSKEGYRKVGDFQAVKDVCRAALKSFASVKDDDIKVTTLTDGITNVLYKVKLTKQNETKTVNVRLNGEGTEEFIDREKELKILQETSNYGQGPELYATFLNGNVYEFIEGKPLTSEELPKYYDKIAKAMKKFHDMDVKCIPKVNGLFPFADTLYKQDLSVRLEKIEDEKFKEVFSNLKEEFKFMTKIVENYEIAFCHNDLLAPNIIYNEKTDEIKFIDFEYACYSPKSFDIADHFFEYTGYDLKMNLYPTKEHQIKFLQMYLGTNDENKIEEMLNEVNVGFALCNLFWGIWGIFQHQNSKIDFDFNTYGTKRIGLYFNWKKEHVSKSNL
eukprot:gene8477-299_t